MSDYIIHQGVDLHKKFFNFCSYDERTGETMEGRVYTNDQDQVNKYLAMFAVPARVAVEATRGWYWFVDALQGAGVKAELSNPKQTKAIAWARVKGDRVDARMLLHLLMADILPTCWIPEKPIRDAREILRYRIKLVRIRTQLMNMVHSYLSKQNLHAPYRSIWTVEGRGWLEGERLSYPHNEMKDYCLQLIDSLTEVIEVYDRKLRELEIMAEEVKLIETIPYVGYTRALTIALETGPIGLFGRSKSYVACCGLAPTTRGSGGHMKQGRLSKEARLVLKWTFIEIANNAWRIDPTLDKYFSGIARRRGRKIAKLSLARKIAKGVYHMLKNKMTFDEYKSKYLAR